MATFLSKKWSQETKNLVNNSKLNLLRVYDNSFIDTESTDILKSHNLETTVHCDFCGQRIKYVSVLEFDKTSVISHFQIGKECMSYLYDYGMSINGLEHVRGQIEYSVKQLIKKSTQRARAEKYKKELVQYISWLDKLDARFIEKNSFLKFINKRLRTGDGVITMKMKSALEGMIKRYTPESTQHIDETKQILLTKIDFLLKDVAVAYGSENGATFNFVSSVREYVNKYGNATRKQLDALNNVVQQIRKYKIERSKKAIKSIFNQTKKESVDSTIPW